MMSLTQAVKLCVTRICEVRATPASSVCQRAFTLIETLVVLVVLGLFASAIVVSLQGRSEGYALQAAAEDLAASIRYAVSASRVARSPHRVVFEEGHGSYRVEAARRQDDLTFVRVVGRAGNEHVLPTEIRLTRVRVDGIEVLEFPQNLEFGGVSLDFHGEIELAASGQDRIRIEVLPETGQVNVIEF